MLKRPTAILGSKARIALFASASPEVSRLLADFANIDGLGSHVDFDEAAAYSRNSLRLRVPQSEIPEGYSSVALVQDPVQRIFNAWRYLANFDAFQTDGIVARLVAKNMPTNPTFSEFVDRYSRYLRISNPLKSSLLPAAACFGKKLTRFDQIYTSEDIDKLRAHIHKVAGGNEHEFEEWIAREPRPILTEATIERLKTQTRSEYKFLNEFYRFEDSPLLNRAFRPGQVDLLKIPVLTAPAVPAYEALRLVCLMRETPATTRIFIEHYRKIGVGKLFLFLDDPDDPMADELAGDPFVEITRCNMNFWPDGNRPGSIEARQSFCYTKIYNMFETGWLICCDADELIYSNENLENLLRRTNPDQWVVRAVSSEAVWKEGEDFNKLFSATHVRWRLKRPHWPRICKPVYSNASNLLRYNLVAHAFGKYIIRCGLNPDKLVVHQAIFPEELSDQKLGFDRDNRTFVYLVHHDARSFDDWCTKLERRLKPGHGFFAQGDVRSMQIKAFSKARDAGKLEELFRQLYVLDEEKLKLLATCNVVGKIGTDRGSVSEG